MTKIKFILTSIIAILLASAAPSHAAQKGNKRPDIVIFLTDDQSQLDLSPYGGREFHTPNMQRLADRGLTFDRAFVASPSCAPSRAALLTGLMPARNGAEPNHARPRAELKKWPAYFQELGYEVVAFGKVSHYKQTADYGFDYFAHDTFHDPDGVPAAVEYLKKRNRVAAKPLCIFVGSNWPHVPWPTEAGAYDPKTLTLPAGSVDTPITRQWRARYAAAVTKADDELGMILDTARDTLPQDTVFLLSSDHGAQWPFAKWNLYDAGIRVPLIISWQGVVKAGSRTDAMVSWIDFLPTLLEVAGGHAPKNLDGRSFLPVLRKPTKSHRDRIFSTHSGDGNWNIYPMRSVRTERWKYIHNLQPTFAFASHIDLPGNLGQRAYWSTWEKAARTDSAAAAIVKRYHERPAEELYDLSTDPHEQRNLASDPRFASQLKRLHNELAKWMKAQGDQEKVYGNPRLLSDPTSYGPNATSGDTPRKPTVRNQ